jgi:hypothetical protein
LSLPPSAPPPTPPTRPSAASWSRARACSSCASLSLLPHTRPLLTPTRHSGFATTWAPGTWVIIGESFAPRTRAKQSALATGSNWLWNFLISFFTPYLSGAIGYAYGFVFASCNLAAAAAVFAFSYESSALTLEAVDMMYNDARCRPWTSDRWAPPGFASRGALAAAEATGRKGGAEVAHHEGAGEGEDGEKMHAEHSPVGSQARLRAHAA